jgi:hypothetical protein
MMRVAALACVLLAWAGTARGQTREVTGQAGLLGEWELTATMTQQTGTQQTGTEQTGDAARLSGPVILRHIGFCSADGPEEKTGELRLLVADPPAQVAATLRIDGTECSFLGHHNDAYDGVLHCPDRRDVPMTLWIR